MPWLRALAFLLAMAFFVILVSPIQALARATGAPLRHSIQLWFCRVMNRIIGIDVAASGALSGASPRFIAANHVSWTDIIAISSLYPLTFLAKIEVASWPALGYLARLQGTVFVDRRRRRDVPKANAALAEALKRGDDLVIFAEGTSSDGSRVLQFNAGHFEAPRALAAGPEPCIVWIVPVAFVYFNRDGQSRVDVGWYGDMTFVPHLWSLMRRGGVRCEVRFGAPIDPRSFPNRKALAEAAQEAVRRLMN